MQERKMVVPFHKPYLDEQEQKAVMRALRLQMIGLGPMVAAFEKEFANYINASHAVALNSCSAALHLAVAALDIGPGDEVITTAFTFCSTALAIIYTGATPVFADIDPNTYCISPESIRSKITKRTKAIIAVHYAGHPCDLDELVAICKEYHLALIEDAAHALPTRYKGRIIGQDRTAITNIVCFSFQATKTLSIGDGGMLVTWDQEIAEKAKKLRLFGMKRHNELNQEIDIALQYGVEMLGYKYNMTDLNASIGRVQLKKLEMMWQMRKAVAQEYIQCLSNCPELVLPLPEKEDEVSYHLFVVRVPSKEIRDRLRAYLADNNITTSIHFIPMTRFSYFKGRCGEIADTIPNVEKTADCVVSLPIYPAMTMEEIHYVTDCVKSFLRSEEHAV